MQAHRNGIKPTGGSPILCVKSHSGKFEWKILTPLPWLGQPSLPVQVRAPGEEVIHALGDSHFVLYLLYLSTCLLAVSCPNCRNYPFTKNTNLSLSVAYKLCGPRPLLLSRSHFSLQWPHTLAVTAAHRGTLVLSLCPALLFPGVSSFYYRVVFEYVNCHSELPVGWLWSCFQFGTLMDKN